MKRLSFVCVMVLLMLLIGCQKSFVNTVPVNKSGVDVIVEDGSQFPEFLVGTWKDDEHGWEFVFEPDGTISSAVIALGKFKITPGEITIVPMRMDGKSIFEPGKWLVSYDPSQRELMVQIVLKNLYVEFGNGIVEGKSTDVFVGKISEDGWTWQVDWTSFPNYTAHTAKHPNFDLSEDPNYGASYSIIFRKITE